VPAMGSARLLVGALAVAVLAGACGSSGGDTAAPGAAVDDPTTSATDPADPPATTDERVVASSDGATPDTTTTDTSANAESPQPASTEQLSPPTEAPVVVPEALQFVAPAVGGGEIDAAALAGKPTIFWFWAPT
jgi:hypothetical protein